MLTYNDIRREQWDAIDFIEDGEDSLILADIGTGKTIIGATSMQNTLVEKRVNRWLLLAPRRVAIDVWPPEMREWAHLPNDFITPAAGDKNWKRVIADTSHKVVALNYELIPRLLEEYPDKLPFDGLVCDEIDKLKSPRGTWFKMLVERIDQFSMRIGLTGTPTPNHLHELWGPVRILTGSQVWPRSFEIWQRENFHPVDFNQYQWAPFKWTEGKLLEELHGSVFRLEGRGLPEVVECPPRYVDLPPKVAQLYKRLERDYIVSVTDDRGRLRTVDAPQAAVLSGKLEQITAGFSYVPPAECTECGGKDFAEHPKRPGRFVCTACENVEKKDAVWHSKAKFVELESLISEMMGKQLLVVYHFQEELAELRKRFKNGSYADLASDVSDKDGTEIQRRWNAGDLEMLAIHPGSAGHGLNLQKSGAHHVATLTRPWSGGLDKQVTGRLARTGQKEERVFVHPIMARNSIDDFKLARVLGRHEAQQRFLDRAGVTAAQ